MQETMFTWLMPFFLLSVSFGACPDPAHVACGGTSCNSELETGCCPNSCGTLTLINEIVSLSRIKREPSDCPDEEEGHIQPDGCKMCVCKYNRRECIYKSCKACMVTRAGNTTKLNHGEYFASGCLQCTCKDGNLECDHSKCLSCSHDGDSTKSGEKKVFGCGTCHCFDGLWTCNEACGTNSAQGNLRFSPGFLLSLILLVHLALHIF